MTKENTIKSIHESLEKGEFSAEEIFKHYHDKINKKNKELNAYLSVFKDPQIEGSRPSVLSGIPSAIKDNILIEGEKCTAASKILENYTATYDAGVISKLKKSGVQFLGKTNMDDSAMGASGESSAFGPTKNPHDLSRVPGGSSSGSAAAVAADLAVFALGSDTGGSIRCPASFCGIVGLNPTYGRVSRHGLIAMASSLDQIGPLTKNVEDAALILNAISGHDEMDATSAKKEVPDFTKNLDKPLKGLRAAVPKEFMGEGLEENVKQLVLKTIAKLESLGVHVDQVSMPHLKYSIAVYYIIVPSEVSANLARLDGIRYGLSEKADNLFDVYAKSKEKGFGPEIKRRIMLGTYALSSGYYDAYYKKAQKVRTVIRHDFDKVFEDFDIIVGPTMPTPAFKLGEKSEDPLSMYLADIFTCPSKLAGLPAISVPCGITNKLPVGFQIIGRHFDEYTLLRVGHQLEKEGIKNQTV
ncbi:MAG: Asp-tRNA(Asn)/Glu-tRNA(Gln) amidotransferase GatCAB subunit A [Candidatus Yanofskybacteria bacterium CG10_big_fil_rev_8_21_14_0_10_36_16]|uniref:Glutamyl-tRNA(Gln) amidotransferase subunit A n=1 Tax=Candidatus Yanofskybacteria bacterium CG10_big_fil_rev_8_21_14_0_10_36_16 TaxID=1975096 RepID=A0A2J0Q6Q7_9BACT|nr:MAG: Asp-tRNA(Asn)/Glu-tRNA(Gln) amidotransferase GatCAB subunit A [Candidatus Yanofskybacteria bacterium CG10_big_fil_rev_8_21_14_0_10_36_16]